MRGLRRSPATGAVSSAAPGRVGRRQYALLEGLRAVAALMVVGYHAHPPYMLDGPWDGALQLNMGVTIFFVLSGFLLYRPHVAARFAGAPNPTVGPYLLRRGLRVLPGYWVALTVFALVLPQFVPVFGRDWWVFYSLGQTWVPGRMFDGLAPAWSLSVEVSFYLALPFYALVLRRSVGRMSVRRQAAVELALFAAVWVGTILVRRFVFDRGEGLLGFLVWSVLGHADWFAAGLALAVASVLWENAARRPWPVRFVERRAGVCWGLAILLFLALGFVEGSPGDIVHIVSLVVAVLLVAPAIFGDEHRGAPRRLLGNGLVRWLGVVSYGIFLWNEPIASWVGAQPALAGRAWGPAVNFVVTATLAIGLGALSYLLVERPFMSIVTRRKALGEARNARGRRHDYYPESERARRSVERHRSVPRKAEPGAPRGRGQSNHVRGNRRMTFVRQYARPVLRRWPIVVAVLVLSIIGTIVWSMTKAATSWMATTALTTQSQTRAPEQDAVLTLGYVDYFNQPTYQQLLRAEARIPSDVVLKAATGAASPILYIQATAPTAEAARSAAHTAADTFRLDIRDGLVAERQREADDLQKQVDAAVADLQKPGTTAAEGNVILDQIRSLQGRITDISSDATNHLKTLQEDPGLASTMPSPALNIVAGAVGGLALGVLIALALAMADGSIRTAADVRRAGGTALAEITSRDDADARARVAEHLLNELRTRKPRPRVIAVVGIGPEDGTRFAADLAAIADLGRERSVLVNADLRGTAQTGPGLVQVLDGKVPFNEALVALPSGGKLLRAGELDDRDPYQVVDPDRVNAVFTELADRAGTAVVVTAPPAGAPETQVLAAAADTVILVVRQGVTQRAALRTAGELLEAVQAAVAGVVIDAPGPVADARVTPVADCPEEAAPEDRSSENGTATGWPAETVADNGQKASVPSIGEVTARIAPSPSPSPSASPSASPPAPAPFRPSPWPRTSTAALAGTNGQPRDGE